MKKLLVFGTIFLLIGILCEVSYGGVVINEVYYDPPGTDTGQEWIELYNSGIEAVELTGYDLDPSDAPYYTFPEFTLSAGDYVVVHINATGTDTSTDLYDGGSTNMSNTQGVIALFSSTTHSADTIVDYVEYGAGGQANESKAVSAGIWTEGDYVPDVDEGHSLEYKGSGDNSSAWFDQAVPTPGVDNSLPVELSSFTARFTPDGVLLKWRTESEIENAGFNLYRSGERNGDFVKVNSNLIEGGGTTAIPQEYKYLDEEFEDGDTLFYIVESVAFDGETNRSETIEVIPLLNPKKKITTLWGELKTAD